jgi:acetyltransferase-like isoleucine patch superfamily enzyme
MKFRELWLKFRIKYAQDEFLRAKLLKKSGINLGEKCWVAANVRFDTEPYLIKIGNSVKITDGVLFVTHDGGVHVLRELGLAPNSDKFGTIIIGNNVFIGKKAIIMPNVKIGNNCIIGAGSIVTKDIEDNSVAVGIPAKKIKNIQEYYALNKDRLDYTKDKSKEQKQEYLLKKFNL